MITIEASNIYFGGGLTLLKTLLRRLDSEHFETQVYINYQEVFNAILNENLTFVIPIKSNPASTFLRYFKKRSHIIYLCNLPPFRKQSTSLLYFHNPHFFDRKVHPFSIRMKLFMYSLWLKFFKSKVDHIACQTPAIQDVLSDHGIHSLLLPFYDEIRPQRAEKIYDFCYVSSGASHKNHAILFDAIRLIAGKRLIALAVTLNDNKQNADIIEKLNSINQQSGVKVIHNLGMLDRNEVISLYSKSKALVFPSLTETFGLPLAEANLCNILCLSSDRAYSYEILSNPIVFDPLRPESIARCMECFLKGEFDEIKQELLIKDKIEDILGLIKED